jgi:hypothetical protein
MIITGRGCDATTADKSATFHMIAHCLRFERPVIIVETPGIFLGTGIDYLDTTTIFCFCVVQRESGQLIVLHVERPDICHLIVQSGTLGDQCQIPTILL